MQQQVKGYDWTKGTKCVKLIFQVRHISFPKGTNMTEQLPQDTPTANEESEYEAGQADQQADQIENAKEPSESKSSKKSPIIIALITVGIVLGLCILLCLGVQFYPLAMEKIFASQLVGQEAPNFTLTTLDGKEVTMSELQGKPVVVNFWATWCPSCVRELAEVQAAYHQHLDEIHFLTVSVDHNLDTVESFATERGLDFPILFDEDGKVSGLYRVRGIPVTVFISSEGVMVKRHIGSLTEGKLIKYLEELQQITESSGETN